MSWGLTVNKERLKADIEKMAEFGAISSSDGRGRTVLPGTSANRHARQYLVDRMEDAGLQVRVDAVGNIVGRWSPTDTPETRAPVATGSHLDSVPKGGIFDGVLGIFAGLESVRALSESEVTTDRPIDIVSFTGEEGTRFYDGVLGSSVASGLLSVEDALAATDEGETLEESLEKIGFRGDGRIHAEEWDAWFEIHIDQTSILEDAGHPVGIITSIVGTTRCHITVEGEADHAGTTSMEDRLDPLPAASEIVLGVERSGRDMSDQVGDSAVTTVGSLVIDPGATNVIAETVELSVDIRDVTQENIEQMYESLHSLSVSIEANRGLEIDIDRPYSISPKSMSEELIQLLQRAVQRSGCTQMSMTSGAGHDTMQVANVTDTAMVFVRSRGGHSHSPQEHADWDDCVTATRVLANALAEEADSNSNYSF